MASINIGGRLFTGRSISIINGRVTIDGVTESDAVSGVVEIKITEGVLGELRTDASVSCLAVTGNVDAGGSVSCGRVGGSVRAGGSVSCDDVAGSVSAGGSISRS